MSGDIKFLSWNPTIQNNEIIKYNTSTAIRLSPVKSCSGSWTRLYIYISINCIPCTYNREVRDRTHN